MAILWAEGMSFNVDESMSCLLRSFFCHLIEWKLILRNYSIPLGSLLFLSPSLPLSLSPKSNKFLVYTQGLPIIDVKIRSCH